jgi:hypothetical protein
LDRLLIKGKREAFPKVSGSGAVAAAGRPEEDQTGISTV